MSEEQRRGALDLPRTIQQANGKPSPWAIVEGNEDGAGVYLVERVSRKRVAAGGGGYRLAQVDRSERVRAHYPAPDGVPAYVAQEIERQYAADLLRSVLLHGRDTRLFIEERYTTSGARRLRVFTITGQAELTNITGYAAKVCTFRIVFAHGGRVHVSMSGGGYSGADHLAESLGYYLYGERFAYDEI